MNHRFLPILFASILLILAIPQAARAVPAAELLSSGRADAAIAALQQQLTATPNNAQARALLARAYYAMERWDEAIGAAQQAVALEPGNSEYHLWLGRAYGQKADQASWVTALSLARKARTEFEKAVQLNGGNVEARCDLAEFYISAPSFLGGGKEKGLVQAEQLRALGKESAALWIQAKIAETDKNFGVAEQDLRAAIAASHSSPETYLNLASFCRRRGRLAEMENLLHQTVEAANKAQRYGLLLEAAQMLNRTDRNLAEALRWVRAYIASPQHSEDAPLFRAYYLVGIIQEKLGDKQAAAGEYRTVLSLASGFVPAQTALKRLE
jgi:tetratricopeptide (TPR) repeat protein